MYSFKYMIKVFSHVLVLNMSTPQVLNICHATTLQAETTALSDLKGKGRRAKTLHEGPLLFSPRASHSEGGGGKKGMLDRAFSTMKQCPYDTIKQ